MFRLKSLRLSNVRSVEQLELSIDPHGATALFGPSGVGKSGILDALPWCLWGDASATTVRRDGSTGPVEVTATIQIRETTIVATRRQTRSTAGTETTTAKLSIDGVRQPNVTAATLTRTMVELTGLTAKTFRGAFYMAQEQLTNLMVGTPATVQDTFEQLTGLDELSRTIDRMRDQCKEARIRAEALPGDPAHVQRTAIDADAARADTEDVRQHARSAAEKASQAHTVWKAADAHARRLQQRQLDARTSLEDVIAAEAVAAETDKALTTAKAAVHAAGADPARHPHRELRELQNWIDQWERLLVELTSHGSALKAETQAAATAHAAAAATRAAAAGIAINSLANRSDEAERAREHAQKRLIVAEKIDTRTSDVVTRLTEARTALARLNTSAVCCPTCQQPLRDAAAALDAIRIQLDGAESDAAHARRALSTARADAARTDRTAREIREEMTTAQTQLAKAEQTEDNARAVDIRRHDAAASLASVVTKITGRPVPPDPDRARQAALRVHARITEELTRTRRLLAVWESVHTAAEQARTASEELSRRRAKVLPSPDAAEVVDAVATADTAHSQLESLQAAAADAAADARGAEVAAMQLADIADDAATKWARKQQEMSRAEEARIARDLLIALRRDLLAEYCDTISAAATEIMQQLGGEHLGFHIDSSFIPQVVLSDGTTRATRQLSGGEKARAAVCAFIGIGRQLAGGGPPGMIFADEITAAQDEAFRREILAMLRALETPMIVVSHTADVLDIASHVIELQRPPMGTTQIAA
ncbi:AAA family ATPase [Nocardia sp. NPDC052566]|uniref:AAA family ATPase n=1 Tax=Nocardia sp. NPDC052566 TaxID=3364330 RepID=UPI0037CB2EF7